MKTQLLQDFDESGSAAQAPAPSPPAKAPPAAVWKRPQMEAASAQAGVPPWPSAQRAAPGAMGGMPGASAQEPSRAGQMRPPGRQAMQGGADQAATQPRQHAAADAWTGPRPIPPDARTAAASSRAQAQAQAAAHAGDTMPRPAGPASATDMPDWLAERLREDAEQDAQRQRNRRMARRALGWSAAATVVAMLAVTGYWFYQESRVEGALDVVANTSPGAPAAPAVLAPAAVRRQSAVPAVAVAAAPSVPVPTTSEAAVPENAAGTAPAAINAAALPSAPPPASAPEVAANAEPAPAAVTDTPAREAGTPAPAVAAAPVRRVPDTVDLPQRRPAAPAHHKQHGRAEAGARSTAHDEVRSVAHNEAHNEVRSEVRKEARNEAGSGPTPAQRREETLMQCRALGYDARECRRRGCIMTHFGLACPG